jgi:hypothetical protein
MTEDGITAAISALEKLNDRGSTNIWAGLEAALDTLRRVDHSDGAGKVRQSSIFLLTDGVPDSRPKSEQDHLQEYLQMHPNFVCQVNTFGFGYSLQSLMLAEVAKRGQGTFGFIPDAKIVGTCFVNTIANSCSSFTQNCNVKVSLLNGTNFAPGFTKTTDATHATFKLGPLQYGQSRDLVVPVAIPGTLGAFDDYISVSVEYTNYAGERVVVPGLGKSRVPTTEARIAYIRSHVVDTVEDIILNFVNGPDRSRATMQELIHTVNSFVLGTEEEDPRLKALREDVDGRVAKAISTNERWQRWGQHYLRAITRAHQLQLRTNFMDPGLQIYGGKLFDSLQHRGGEIFVSLPMTTSRTSYSSYSSTPASTSTYTSQQTTYYAGGGGGCFDASTTVIVKQGEGEIQRSVTEVRKGDSVLVVEADGARSWAQVRCVVRLEREQGADDLVEFKKTGLKITKRHPVRLNGTWVRPIDLVCEEPENFRLCRSSDSHVINFVLDRRQVSLLVNSVECPTFGHGISEEVAWHPFYASQEVLSVLSSFPEFQLGLVSVRGSLHQMFKRNASSFSPFAELEGLLSVH